MDFEPLPTGDQEELPSDLMRSQSRISVANHKRDLTTLDGYPNKRVRGSVSWNFSAMIWALFFTFCGFAIWDCNAAVLSCLSIFWFIPTFLNLAWLLFF